MVFIMSEHNDRPVVGETETGDDVITVYRRMHAASAGARAERDIMRAAVEAIAAGDPDPVAIAQAALDADRARREANLAALIASQSSPDEIESEHGRL